MNTLPRDSLTFFLGGYDLEMVTIRDLLRDRGARVIDKLLAWGASASAYHDEILREVDAGRIAVLVELADDPRLAELHDSQRLRIVDHHGPLAGRHAPTAIEQVFQLLQGQSHEWTRWLALVAANDRGHIRAMRELNATAEEMCSVRAADRAAQGITSEEELAGRDACGRAESLWSGVLTVVRLPHHRTATVTDALDENLGGVGYRNLLVLSPRGLNFFGAGVAIQSLNATFPGGYFGGELPERGFWGHPVSQDEADVMQTLLTTLMPQ